MRKRRKISSEHSITPGFNPMLPIPIRIANEFWPSAEDALYAAYHQTGWKVPWITPENLVISVALKIERWLEAGIPLSMRNADVAIFAVLSWKVSRKDALWTWRMAQTIARLGVVQALLEPEFSRAF